MPESLGKVKFPEIDGPTEDSKLLNTYLVDLVENDMFKSRYQSKRTSDLNEFNRLVVVPVLAQFHEHGPRTKKPYSNTTR